MPTRIEREPVDFDLFRLYLDEIGQHQLLTREDEVRLSQAYEAGLEGPARAAGAGSWRSAAARPDGDGASWRAGPPDDGRVQSPPGGLDRAALLRHRAAAGRPGPGGQSRAPARGREVRLAQGLQVLHLCDLVDPPGDHPRGG